MVARKVSKKLIEAKPKSARPEAKQPEKKSEPPKTKAKKADAPVRAFVNYSTEPIDAFTIANPVKIYYRKAEGTTIEQRRYYIGHVQFAYVRKTPEGWLCTLTNGMEEMSVKGRVFETEKALDFYLVGELSGEGQEAQNG